MNSFLLLCDVFSFGFFFEEIEDSKKAFRNYLTFNNLADHFTKPSVRLRTIQIQNSGWGKPDAYVCLHCGWVCSKMVMLKKILKNYKLIYKYLIKSQVHKNQRFLFKEQDGANVKIYLFTNQKMGGGFQNLT